MEGARFADREGFTAVWTPERHFHAFGGLYPNPVVTSAAVAAITSRVQIRAGSCVLPLHHPVRVAEDWAFVDNISNGRIGVSFASGWQPNDFILMPDAFAKRQDELISRMETVRRLWRGEALPFPGPNGNMVETRTLPRPVQKELPVWITAAGNPKTFEQAGILGCRLLTHLLGQKVEDVAEKLQIYRAAWLKAGHPGKGHVTLMLHTFVGADEEATRETAREPMKKYLRSSVDLIKKAAWSFPTFVERGAASGKTPQEIMESAPLSDAEMDALLDHAFNRYYGTSALIGTPERCLELVDKVQAAGVDEIACLIDFGIAPTTVLEHLNDLKGLMEAAKAPRPSTELTTGDGAPRRVSVAENVLQHGVTHLQCTPSMAAMLLADAPGRAALARLQALMVGGEALPLEMATQLRALVPGAVLNMYGPTETTVWSTTCSLEKVGRLRAARPADREHAAVDPHALGRGVPGLRARRAVHRRRRRHRRLPAPARAECRALRRGRRAALVPHRRPGAAPARRRARVPRPHGPPGQAARPPHRAGRDRERAAAAGRREAGGGGGARGRRRAEVPGRLRHGQGRAPRCSRRRCARRSRRRCPRSWCRRPCWCCRRCR